MELRQNNAMSNEIQESMKIIPHLWYTAEAIEAAEWYTSLIDNGRINWQYVIKDTPAGDAALVEFTLANLTLAAINGGDYFKLNESISLILKCSSREEVLRLHAALSEGGRELMPLGEYDFCKQYVWLSDKYGLNWQIMLDEEASARHHLDICLLFDLEQVGNALPALEYYRELLSDGQVKSIAYYDGSQPIKAAKVVYSELDVDGCKLVAMDHGYGGNVTFNEAFSLMVYCDTDAELDRYWAHLSHVKEAEQCGWGKDKFGVSWQIVPSVLMRLYDRADEATLQRVNQAVMGMKKISAAAIEELLGV